MDTIKEEVVDKNRAYLKDVCSKDLQSMYDILIKPKITKGDYFKSGGYKIYREDFARLRENVKQRQPRADSNLLQMCTLEFEGRYRKQDEEIMEKAELTESQIKDDYWREEPVSTMTTEMQEQGEKLELEKSELMQNVELKRKEEAEKLELYKVELSTQREKEKQELKEKYEQMVLDCLKAKEVLESKLKENADLILKLRKRKNPTTVATTQGKKPPMRETVLKTMLSFVRVFGHIGTGVYEHYSST